MQGLYFSGESIPFPGVSQFVHGDWRASNPDARFATLNPSTGETLTWLSQASTTDIDLAVKSCRAALNGVWLDTTRIERAQCIRRLAETIDFNLDRISAFECVETGKPIIDCRADVKAGSELLRFYAAKAEHPMEVDVALDSYTRAMMTWEPYGVAAILVPFNYPFYIACARLAPALIAGNACILKPSELSSLSALILAQLAYDSGLPRGVLNVLIGGKDVGMSLAEHQEVDMICLTGSTTTGRLVLAASARSNLKAVSLELSGNCSAIVCNDADIEASAEAIVMSGFYNVGQSCTACSKVLVAQSAAESLTEAICSIAATLRVGDPTREETQIGPMISAEALNSFAQKLEASVISGANVVFGGNQLTGEVFQKGFFHEPTVLESVPESDYLANNEVFGPLLMIKTYSSVDEALSLANHNAYGLAASVYTADEKQRDYIAQSLECGTVWCNCTFRESPMVSTCGWKLSGQGWSHGPRAIEAYARTKAIWTNAHHIYERWT